MATASQTCNTPHCITTYVSNARNQSIGISASAHQAGRGIATGLKVARCFPAIGGN